MQEERDELVKRVFPLLRRKCEERGVVWGEVDLRWGITDEQSAEQEVLPICLAEINRCRPCFIGILGERYGWVQDEFPESLANSQPWLAGYQGHSITHLEVIHGVLKNENFDGHAFFYFRDPQFVRSLPNHLRDAFEESTNKEELERLGAKQAAQNTENRRQQLLGLKQEIRDSGLPVRENYRNPAEFGRLVYDDVSKLIDEVFPVEEQPDRELAQIVQHQQFALARSRIYVARPDTFAKLDEFATTSGPPVALTGESGGGKTSLLANWMLRFSDANPELPVVYHFVGSTPESTSHTNLLRQVMSQLKRTCSLTGEIPDGTPELIAAFREWLFAASATSPVVLVLDGLNQLDQQNDAQRLDWLPEQLPANLRLFVSILPSTAADEVSRRGYEEYVVQPLSVDEQRTLVDRYLGFYSKTLAARHVDQIVASDQTKNPLYLKLLLEELRLFGEHERLSDQISYYLSAKTLPDLYAAILQRYEQDYERQRPGLVCDTLSAIWSSRRGMTEGELRELLGSHGQPLPQAYWSPFYLAVESILILRNGLLSFSHDYLRSAVEQRYLETDRKKTLAHLRLADYFETREFGRVKTRQRFGVIYVALFLVWLGLVLGVSYWLLPRGTDIERDEYLLAIAPVPAIGFLLIAVVVFAASWGSKWLRAVRRWLAAGGVRRPLTDRPLGERTVVELPWQLRASGKYWRLYDLLKDPQCLLSLYRADRHETIKSWHETETNTYDTLSRSVAQTDELRGVHRNLCGGRTSDAYGFVLQRPAAHLEIVPAVADCLAACGADNAAWKLLDRVTSSHEKDDRSEKTHVRFRLEQARLLRENGLSVAASAFYEDTQQWIVAAENPSELADCLVSRAEIALEHTDSKAAAELLSQAEPICLANHLEQETFRCLIVAARVDVAAGDLDAAAGRLDECDRIASATADLRLRLEALRVRQLLNRAKQDTDALNATHQRCLELTTNLGLDPVAADPPEVAPPHARISVTREVFHQPGQNHVLKDFCRIETVRILVEECDFPLAAKHSARAVKSSRLPTDPLRRVWSELRNRLENADVKLGRMSTRTYRRKLLRPIVILIAATCVSLFFVGMMASEIFTRSQSASLSFDIALIVILLPPGLLAVFIGLRSLHAIIRGPRLELHKAGLYVEHWRWRLTSLSFTEFLGVMLRPVNRIEREFVLWEDLTNANVETQFVGGSALVLTTSDRNIVVGNVFSRNASKIADDIRQVVGLDKATAGPIERNILGMSIFLTFVSSLFLMCLPFIGPVVTLILYNHNRKQLDQIGDSRVYRYLHRATLVLSIFSIVFSFVMLGIWSVSDV